MKISRKKTVGLMLLFVMLISAIMPTMATALTYSLSDGSIINSYNVTTDVVTLYIGNVSKDGTSQFRYLYTDKAVNAATLTEIGKILTSDYSGLLPTTEGQVKACSDSTIEVQDFFTDAGVVAAGKFENLGTVSDTSSTILYEQTQYNSLVSLAQDEIKDESKAESDNLTDYNGRELGWNTAEQEKLNIDPNYTPVAFPEKYVKAFDDSTTYPDKYFIADSIGTKSTDYIIRNGVVTQVDTYPIYRTIILVENTSADVTTTPVAPEVSNVVSNLDELQAALNSNSLSEVIITNAITLPNGTVLDGKGKTVRVEKPYVKEDGQLEESPSSGNIFNIDNGSDVSIKNMTIMGGQKSSSGAVSSQGNLTLENVNVVRSNRGLDNYGGSTVLKNCNFSLNVGQSAGAIWCGNGAKIILDGCSFTQNRSNGGSGYGGGAIGASGAKVYANNTIFANNSTQEIGGAINIYGGNVYLMNCTVAGNCSSGGNEYYGGGIGKNGGVFHAVNSIFIDNYAKISGDKTRSDIGIYSESNGTLNNCVYSKMQGSVSSTTNCKVDESNSIASTYTDNGIILANGSTSTSFSHPVLTTGTNSYSKYVIVKASGSAATGGVNTYFDYSDRNNVKMGYGDSLNINSLGGLATPTSDKKVTTYYEGGSRVSGVIGASEADGVITVPSYTVTVTNDGNGTAEANPSSGETGTEVTLIPTPKNSDYRFKEWQVISGDVTINSENKLTIGTSNVEIKAVFEEIATHTVTFKDGEKTLYTQEIANGEVATRPTTNPTKEGFSFVDWYMDSTLTTKYNFSTPITSDILIYAKWNRIPFPFTDNFESYDVGTTIASGGTEYTVIYNGTGDGNQVVLQGEQKDGTTGNILQLQGASGWSSQIKYSFTPDDKQYLIVETDVKPLSVNSPAGISLCSSSAGGSWTHSVCGINMTNGGFSYGRNDNGYPIDTDLTYTTGNWYHLTLVLDRTNQRFYTLLNDTFIEETSYDADSATPEWLEINSNNHGTNTAYFDNIKLYSSDTFNITFSQTHLVTITGGTSSPELSAEENTVVTITADEAPSGAEFYKWKVVSGGITLADDTSATTTFTMGAKDVEVIAMYKYIIQGQITYELRDSYGDGWHGNNYINIVDVSNDATVESLTMSGSALNGTTQNLEPGHIYELRWQIGSYPGECSFTLKDEDGNILITRNGDVNVSNAGIFLTVGIKEPTPKHTVSFETYGGGTIDSQTIEEGQKATRPTTDPTRAEYNFTNWYADETMTALFDFTKPIAEDTVIYAGYTKDVWVDNTVDESKAIIISEVKVKETLTGEENAKETFNEEVFTTYTSNASSTEIAGKINLARTAAEDYITTNGYTNKGVTNTTSVEREWDNRKYETDDGVYSSTENALIKTHTASGGYGKETTYKMFYSAEYTKKQFTVSFMDGTNEISSQIVIDGNKATKPDNPAKANYEFVNWYEDSTLTTVFDFSTPIQGSMCIYAKFSPVYHDITLSLTDGMNVDEIESDEAEATLELLGYVGLITYEEDETENLAYFYNKDHKLLFTMDEEGIITFAEGVTYKDNITYTPTDEEKALLARAGVFGSTYTLSFGEAPFEYVILEGANQTHTVNQDGSLTVKANGDISKFVKLLVDRIEVAEKDRTIVSGSTVATLSKEFLDTLSEGTHELTFVYTDGEVSTNFTIARVSMPTQTGGDVGTPVAGTPVQLLSKSPITGDNIILWIILLIISVNGLIATEVYIRKVFKK